MTNFNSIWNASIDRAAGLRKKISSVIGETDSENAGARRETEAPASSAVPQAALDHLLIQVSKSVSEAMEEFPLTKNMNFSKSFSAAFTPSPFHRTSPSLNSSLTATSVASLAKNIYREASSAQAITPEEKDSLMTAVLSGVNHGFMTSIDTLKSSGAASSADIENIEKIQNIAQANIGGYYSASQEVSGEQNSASISRGAENRVVPGQLWSVYNGITSYISASAPAVF